MAFFHNNAFIPSTSNIFMSLFARVTIPIPDRGHMLMPQRFDYRNIMELTNEEFSQFYLELMTEYKDNVGWWSEGRIPHCSNCHEIIPGPAQLRRYHGQTLHAKCFKTLWEKERGSTKGLSKQFFDRVAGLTLGD